jgi:hypothetical protein
MKFLGPGGGGRVSEAKGFWWIKKKTLLLYCLLTFSFSHVWRLEKKKRQAPAFFLFCFCWLVNKIRLGVSFPSWCENTRDYQSLPTFWAMNLKVLNGCSYKANYQPPYVLNIRWYWRGYPFFFFFSKKKKMIWINSVDWQRNEIRHMLWKPHFVAS